jgi:hypothetical protein
MILYKQHSQSTPRDRSVLSLHAPRESAKLSPLIAKGSGHQMMVPKREVLTLFRWALYLMLCGYLVFAHGCHGDVDDELFMAARSALGQGISSAP